MTIVHISVILCINAAYIAFIWLLSDYWGASVGNLSTTIYIITAL